MIRYTLFPNAPCIDLILLKDVTLPHTYPTAPPLLHVMSQKLTKDMREVFQSQLDAFVYTLKGMS